MNISRQTRHDCEQVPPIAQLDAPAIDGERSAHGREPDVRLCLEDRRSTGEKAGCSPPKLASVRLPALTWRSSLLLAGSIAAPALVGSFLVQQSRRLEYNPRRHPVSSLALGPQGGQQKGTFFITGTLLLLG